MLPLLQLATLLNTTQVQLGRDGTAHMGWTLLHQLAIKTSLTDLAKAHPEKDDYSIRILFSGVFRLHGVTVGNN